MKIHKDSGDVIEVKLNVRLDVPEEVTFLEKWRYFAYSL